MARLVNQSEPDQPPAFTVGPWVAPPGISAIPLGDYAPEAHHHPPKQGAVQRATRVNCGQQRSTAVIFPDGHPLSLMLVPHRFAHCSL